MTDIDIGKISEALNNKVDLPNPTVPQDAVDYVVEVQRPTADNGYTWYRKYKSGWVEQGGRFSNASGTGQIALTATTPIPVSSAGYVVSPEYVSGQSVVVVTSYYSGTTMTAVLEKNNSTNTQNTTASGRWYLYGYATE